MSLDKRKTDPELGDKISALLTKQKVETPFLLNGKTDERKVEVITKNVSNILQCLGLDEGNENLCDTPKRVAKMYVYETLWGLDYNNFPKVMTVKNTLKSPLVVERNINVTTLCAHHWQNIIGVCHIGYIPNGRLLGLSKLHRVVEFFSRRPQIQEMLIEQIYYALSYILETTDIVVTIKAKHYCIIARGVEDHNSDTVTTKLGGCFMDDITVRSEYYTALKI